MSSLTPPPGTNLHAADMLPIGFALFCLAPILIATMIVIAPFAFVAKECGWLPRPAKGKPNA